MQKILLKSLLGCQNDRNYSRSPKDFSSMAPYSLIMNFPGFFYSRLKSDHSTWSNLVLIKHFRAVQGLLLSSKVGLYSRKICILTTSISILFRQGTPSYLFAVLERFSIFVKKIFRHSKKGRWFYLLDSPSKVSYLIVVTLVQVNFAALNLLLT